MESLEVKLPLGAFSSSQDLASGYLAALCVAKFTFLPELEYPTPASNTRIPSGVSSLSTP